MLNLISRERIVNTIFVLRDRKVMLDYDLAELYGVETRVLVQAVKRNQERFPVDFMFQLAKFEAESIRSQIVTLKKGQGQHRKYQPYAFTEQGVAMLSSVLKSKRAVQVNIQIIRTFTQLREMLMNYRELKEKIAIMESQYNKNFRVVFDALRRFVEEEEKPKPQIGFR